MSFDGYPNAPGAKARDTSREAAVSVAARAATLRACALAAIADYGPLTADQVAELLRESVLAVRPRLSELAARGLVVDSGIRRPNASGRSAIAWSTA